MEITQLKYFQTAAYYEHISKAAEHLNISQPALSTIISKLEDELGVKLFDKKGRSVVLNDNGRVFLDRVNHILSEIEDAKKEMADLGKLEDRAISLAVSSSQFLQGMQTFMKIHKEYNWNQRVGNIREIRSLLEEGKIDIAVTSPGIYGKDIESVLLLHDTFKLAVHKDNPLAQKDSVKLADIQNERFILLMEGLPLRTQTDEIFADLGIKPRYMMECDHLLRRELINANAGVTIASGSSAYRHIYKDAIKFLDLEDVHRTKDIVLSYRKDGYLSNAAKDFIEFMKDKFNEPEDA